MTTLCYRLSRTRAVRQMPGQKTTWAIAWGRMCSYICISSEMWRVHCQPCHWRCRGGKQRWPTPLNSSDNWESTLGRLRVRIFTRKACRLSYLILVSKRTILRFYWLYATVCTCVNIQALVDSVMRDLNNQLLNCTSWLNGFYYSQVFSRTSWLTGYCHANEHWVFIALIVWHTLVRHQLITLN